MSEETQFELSTELENASPELAESNKNVYALRKSIEQYLKAELNVA